MLIFYIGNNKWGSARDRKVDGCIGDKDLDRIMPPWLPQLEVIPYSYLVDYIHRIVFMMFEVFCYALRGAPCRPSISQGIRLQRGKHSRT